MADKQYVCVDVETTGLAEHYSKIIELGSVKVDITTGKIIDIFSSFADPETKIPPKITELTGITDQMVCGSKPTDIVVKEWYNWLGDKPIIFVAHNLRFDLKFLVSSLKRANVLYDDHLGIDTLQWARTKLQHASYKLEYLAEQLNFKDGLASHRAKDDSIAAIRLLAHLTKAEGVRTREELHEILIRKSKKISQLLARSF